MVTTTNNEFDFLCINVNTSVSGYHTSTFIHNDGSHKMKGMKHKAISDVIATLLLLGITVAGAVLVSAFFQGNNIFSPNSNNAGTQTASLKIVGYDTRDGTTISGISTFDNVFDSTLTSGTEFIVLNVDNQGISKVVLQSIGVNGVDHTWDQSTGNLPPTYPTAGKFSIIPTSNDAPIPLSPTNEIQSNDEVRIVIKLSSSITPDINLNEPIRIKFTTNLIDNSETLITSGGVR
ncbi:MAG: archaellin/type IV pilin N-terminal domain-containing protein [Nitrosopumilaceae archaeon]